MPYSTVTQETGTGLTYTRSSDWAGYIYLEIPHYNALELQTKDHQEAGKHDVRVKISLQDLQHIVGEEIASRRKSFYQDIDPVAMINIIKETMV